MFHMISTLLIPSVFGFFRNPLTLMSGATLILAASGLKAQTYEFNAPSGDWGDAANWTPFGPPTAGSNAGIGTAATQTVNIGTGVSGVADSVVLDNGSGLNLLGSLLTESISGYGTFTFDGGTLRAQGPGASVGTSNPPPTPNPSYITGNGAVIDSNGFDLTINGYLNDAAGQTGFLTKVGAGTLYIAESTYTGATIIEEGTVAFGSSKSSLASPQILIRENGILDTSFVFVGYLIPSGGQITFGLGGSGDNGFLNTGAGTFGLNSAALVLDSGLSSFTAGDSWDLYEGSKSGNFSGVSFTGQLNGTLTRTGEIWTGTVGAYDFTLDQTTGVLSVSGTVPEPGPALLLAAGLGLAFTNRRRR